MLSYSELMGFESYEDRLNYLRTDSVPGEMTFGPMRRTKSSFLSISFVETCSETGISA